MRIRRKSFGDHTAVKVGAGIGGLGALGVAGYLNKDKIKAAYIKAMKANELLDKAIVMNEEGSIDSARKLLNSSSNVMGRVEKAKDAVGAVINPKKKVTNAVKGVVDSVKNNQTVKNLSKKATGKLAKLGGSKFIKNIIK